MVRPAAAPLALLAAVGMIVVPRGAAQGTAPTGSLRGVVYDSLITSAPLVAAEVWIEGTNRTARTDDRGRFEFSALSAGRYTLGFTHPILDSTGLSAPPSIVQVTAGQTAEVALVTPGPEAAHRILCPHDPWRSAGVVLGLVLDAATARPFPGVTVTASWTTYVLGNGSVHGQPLSVVARSDESGRLLLCNVPTDVALLVQGHAGDGPDGMLLVDLAGRTFGRADLRLATAEASGTVSGVVRSREGVLLAGAVVTPIGTQNHASADKLGGFTLHGVQAGSRLVEATAVGYGHALAQTTIRPGETQRLEIVMGDSIPILAPVLVEGERRSYLARVGFMQRRATAQGHFLDTVDVRRSQARRFEEVFRLVPGVNLRPNGTGYLVELRRGEGQLLNPRLANYCPPAYFIDGVYYPLPPIQTPSVPVVPEEILAIEVYSDLFSAPPQYQRRDSGCGIILVWTKRGVPNRER